MIGIYKPPKRVYKILRCSYTQRYFYIMLVNNVKCPKMYYDCIAFIENLNEKVVMSPLIRQGHIKHMERITNGKLQTITMKDYLQMSQYLKKANKKINLKIKKLI